MKSNEQYIDIIKNNKDPVLQELLRKKEAAIIELRRLIKKYKGELVVFLPEQNPYVPGGYQNYMLTERK